MKRVFSLFFSLFFIVGICSSYALAKESDFYECLQYGFRLVEMKPCKGYDCEVILYEHIKSGAQLIHIKTNDKDKGFQVSYKTRTTDDMGTNHVIEHCICSGSEKYPDKDLFFNVLGKTGNTFMNAFTSYDHVSYIVSSMFESQLLKCADVFMDSTLHPLFIKDKRIFDRESHRFELENKDDPIKINGTVYNEMKMQYSELWNSLVYKSINTLFADSDRFYDSGGNPDFIPDMKYEDAVNLWKEYYHPSNSLITLYGDLDVLKFMKLLNNDYLSQYERKDITIQSSCKKLLDGPIKKEINVPITVDKNVGKQVAVAKVYGIENGSKFDLVQKYAKLALVMNSTNSAFKRNITKELPSCIPSVWYQPVGEHLVIGFSAFNIDEKDVNKFYDVVDKSIEEITTTGFSDDSLSDFDESSVKSKCNKIFMRQGMKSGYGVVLMTSISAMWACSDGDLSYIQNIDADTLMNKDELINIFNTVASSKHTASVEIIPDEEMIKEKAKRLSDVLEKMKSNMSVDEINSLIKSTKKLNEWLLEKHDSEIINKIKNVNIEELDEKVKVKDTRETFVNGVRVISTLWDSDDVYRARVIIDTTHMTKYEMKLIRFLSEQVWGKFDTKRHTSDEIASLLNNQLYLFLPYPGKFMKSNKTYRDIDISWYGNENKVKSDLELIKEVFAETIYSNKEKLLAAISCARNFSMSISKSSPQSTMINRGFRFLRKKAYASALRDQVDYCNFLNDLEKQIEDNPEKVGKEMLATLAKLFMVDKISICVAASSDEVENRVANVLLSGIKGASSSVSNLSIKNELNLQKSEERSPRIQVSRREAFVCGGDVQTNGVVAIYGNSGLLYNGKLLVLCQLMNDDYFIPHVRHKLGAYGCYMYALHRGIVLLSSRDPNIKETWKIFEGFPDAILNLKITQSELDNVKVKVYSDVVRNSVYYENDLTCSDRVNGITAQDRQKILDDIKDTTVEDIKVMLGKIGQMMKDAYYFTAGDQEKINNNKDMFDNVIT